MSTTLKDAINSIKPLSITSKPRRKTSDALLGKYENIIPKGKTSTEFIRDIRGSLYGKIKE